MPFFSHAYYSLGDFETAVSACKRGLALDPSNSNLKTTLKNAEARINPDHEDLPELVPEIGSASNNVNTAAGANLGNMADALRGMGGGGSMPDIASMLQNPMMMQMAQQMMDNGGLESLMSNPAVANMVQLFTYDPLLIY